MAPPRRSRKSFRKALNPSQANISSMIQKALVKNAEHKFFDTVVTNNPNATYVINALTQNIIQGTGGAQRIGDNIRLISLTYKARYDIISGTNTDVRVIIVLDKMNVGIAPVVGDLLVNTSITSTYSAQQIKEKRFTVIYDRIANINNAGRNSLIVQKTFKLNNVVEYNGTANATADNGKNSMWLFTVSTEPTNVPTLKADCQVMFIDV